MASLTKAINKDFFDSVLPTYGNPRVNVPKWDENQKMFIFDEYESNSGNRYYRGLRFCNRVVIVENFGQYHSWTYIDSLELYAFNGKKLELVQKKDYNNVFRDEDIIRKDSETMLKNYLKGVLKIQKSNVPVELLDDEVKKTIDGCYKSFLDDDFDIYLTQIIPKLER